MNPRSNCRVSGLLALSFLIACSSPPNTEENFQTEMTKVVREAGEGRLAPEIESALERVQSELLPEEQQYLASVAWWNLEPELWLQDPIFRRAMRAAAEPGRTGPPHITAGGTGGEPGMSSMALSRSDLEEWVTGNARIFAAVGVTAVGSFACAGSFTGVGAVGCGVAIAYVASAMLPVNASEVGFDSLPDPDEPASAAEYRAHVDPGYVCPSGYSECGTGYCNNLASVYRHCGECGNLCESGLCVDGECATSADAGPGSMDAGGADTGPGGTDSGGADTGPGTDSGAGSTDAGVGGGRCGNGVADEFESSDDGSTCTCSDGSAQHTESFGGSAECRPFGDCGDGVLNFCERSDDGSDCECESGLDCVRFESAPLPPSCTNAS